MSSTSTLPYTVPCTLPWKAGDIVYSMEWHTGATMTPVFARVVKPVKRGWSLRWLPSLKVEGFDVTYEGGQGGEYDTKPDLEAPNGSAFFVDPEGNRDRPGTHYDTFELWTPETKCRAKYDYM